MKIVSFLTLLLVSTLSLCAQTGSEGDVERSRARVQVPWAVWAGSGYGPQGLSFAVGVRRASLGIGLGYVRDIELEIPVPSGTAPAGTAVTESKYALQSAGADLYTFTTLMDWLAGYGTIGLYTNINAVVLRDSTGRTYESPSDPDWDNLRVTYGAGLEAYPYKSLLVGIGYHADRGFNLHLGVIF